MSVHVFCKQQTEGCSRDYLALTRSSTVRRQSARSALRATMRIPYSVPNGTKEQASAKRGGKAIHDRVANYLQGASRTKQRDIFVLGSIGSWGLPIKEATLVPRRESSRTAVIGWMARACVVVRRGPQHQCRSREAQRRTQHFASREGRSEE